MVCVPPVCPHPVIFVRGNGHTPRPTPLSELQNWFWRARSVVLPFPPPPKIARYVSPPPPPHFTVFQLLGQLFRSLLNQKNVGNPNHHYFSKKYRHIPPIRIAIRLQSVLQYFWCPYTLRKGKYCQCSSHLYRSTSPICIAIRLPLVSRHFWENLGGCGHQDVPH